MTALDMAKIDTWVGRQKVDRGHVAAYPADMLNATLDRNDPRLGADDPIPPGWHIMYFPELVMLGETGRDGHARLGGFLPPIPLERRMWAATSMMFHRPLKVGESVTRTTTIREIAPKDGGTGPLVFVTVRNEIAGDKGDLATTEDHTTVYRGPAESSAAAPPPRPAPGKAVWKRTIHPSSVLLFRFSALTMNSHRIHYDREYTTKVEGYPGLLVHGPLTMTLLLDLFRREKPKATLKTFKVRAVSPLYDTADYTVEGEPGADGKSARLWAMSGAGALAMQADATFED
ncbi:MAG: acyl-CoA dehydrogenase [Alphaproteobacteria bacterium]|nr:acyl-CoA dehydrogenase [Alphaproteobacteria bacterium]